MLVPDKKQIPIRGRQVPDHPLSASGGGSVRLNACRGLCVVFIFPRITTPLQEPIAGWAEIPGAKGCTVQNEGYARDYGRLKQAGVEHVFGLSTQPVAVLWEAVQRLHLPYRLLSDPDLGFADALDLPRFEAGGEILLSRTTMILRDAVVEHVIHPVPDPEKNSAAVLDYLATLSQQGATRKCR